MLAAKQQLNLLNYTVIGGVCSFVSFGGGWGSGFVLLWVCAGVVLEFFPGFVFLCSCFFHGVVWAGCLVC